MSNSPLYNCFVMMPHGGRGEYERGESEADHVYSKIVKPAVEKALGKIGEIVHVEREVDEHRPGGITRSIITKIARSDFAIADITGSNANVFLELGVRYTLRKNITILMRQQGTLVPFDIGNHRCIAYDPFKTEIAIENLCNAIKAAQADANDRPDSPVYEVFPNLEVTNSESGDRPMPWSVYWAKLNAIRLKLQEAKKANTYNPDIIVGISNGGAIVADLLILNREYDCPMVSFWADRKSMKAIFENEINISIVKGITAFLRKEPSETRILLIDDYISSANTCHQAMDFIRQYIPNCHIRFLPLLYREDRNLQRVEKEIVWKHRAFNYSDETIHQIHQVYWHKFPYEKDIRAM
jgi:hypoxanthine phosphoribosyltransferase